MMSNETQIQVTVKTGYKAIIYSYHVVWNNDLTIDILRTEIFVVDQV